MLVIAARLSLQRVVELYSFCLVGQKTWKMNDSIIETQFFLLVYYVEPEIAPKKRLDFY